jgi:DNA-binding NarL/FixJ family response regulator
MLGFLLSDDLIFTSRITGTAQDLGFRVIAARTPRELETRAAAEGLPRCVIVDLANPGLDIVALVKRFKMAENPAHIVAYGSHVDTATLKAARDAGCDVVWPRSKFVEELATSLPEWFSGKARPE